MPEGDRRPVRCSGRALFSLFLVGVSVFAVASAWRWPFKAAFFPLVVGVPLIVLAGVQLVLDLRGRGAPAAGPAMDLQLGGDVPDEVARRRAARLFAWIAGFVVLVAVVGFPVAVPIFMASYLGLESRVGWRMAAGLTVAAWAFFHGVFQWLLRLPFESGWIQTWLGW
jgi:tripartite tricarboxylate transporter TctB family protein